MGILRTCCLAAAAWIGIAACGRSSDITGAAGPATAPTVGINPDTADFKACAEKSEKATLVPVSMFITIDKSGSMKDPVNGTPKWDALKSAFTTFFGDKSAASLNVAMRFWPLDNCDAGMKDANCPNAIAACATPSVPLGPLSDMKQQNALIMGLNATMPQGDTPMSIALGGAVEWARVRSMSNMGEKVIVVLVTDGEPTACDKDPAHIAGLAADAFSKYGVLTYVIGFPGAAKPTLDAIAKAGGTNAGLLLASSGNTEMEFLSALLEISGKSVACGFPVPTGQKPTETNLVSVVYTPGSGAAGKLSHVDGPMQCSAGGWYYDKPTSPTTITLCDATCATVKADSKAAIDIKIGCKCMTDADCPTGTICSQVGCVVPCTGVDCNQGGTVPGGPSNGGVVVAGDEAVQGGAFTCGVARAADRSAWPWLGLAVVLLRRRRNKARR